MKKPIVAAVLATIALLPSTAVEAQSWRLQPRVQREIQSDINGLARDIARAEDRRTISRRDANEMKREAERLQRTFNSFSRDGLSRHEVEVLESQVNRIRTRLHLKHRRWASKP